MSKLEKYMKLKSGTDIRGVAVETAGSPVTLTDEAVYDLTIGFLRWLERSGNGRNMKIAVGHDSRISSERIKNIVCRAAASFEYDVYDCGLSSTPAMFMTTVDLNVTGAIQITASHHPYDRNGLKFFAEKGGLDHGDLEEVIRYACEPYHADKLDSTVTKIDYMKLYARRLRDMICEGVGAEDYEHPLKGYKIVVDAGNGVGGFYAEDVLAPLGADTSGSRFLEPDGMFPNHSPNPEDKAAMESIRCATLSAGADLGVIFDTDVDRAGCVDKDGREINRNRLIALASVIALEGNSGGTIVTDSVTSPGLADFIESIGGVHYRYRRGYRNVINKQIILNKSGTNCPLAIETSGHGAFRDNYYLDDGAFLMTKIIIKMAKLGADGKTLGSLIETLKEPAEAIELRPRILTEEFRAYGDEVVDELSQYASVQPGWKIAGDNREGVRIYIGDGWFLLRLSVHDPIMPFNAESDSEGGVKPIVEAAFEFLKRFEKLDLSCFEEYLLK